MKNLQRKLSFRIKLLQSYLKEVDTNDTKSLLKILVQKNDNNLNTTENGEEIILVKNYI